MTISECLINWLRLFDNSVIMTDRLDAFQQTFGLIKSPSGSRHSDVTGRTYTTRYYTFLVKKPCSVEEERKAAQSWLEELEDWIYQKEEPYPTTLDAGEFDDIQISSSFGMMGASLTEARYGLILKVTITEEAREREMSRLTDAIEEAQAAALAAQNAAAGAERVNIRQTDTADGTDVTTTNREGAETTVPVYDGVAEDEIATYAEVNEALDEILYDDFITPPPNTPKHR